MVSTKDKIEDLKQLLLSNDKTALEKDFDKLRLEVIESITAIEERVANSEGFLTNMDNSKEHIIDLLGPMIGKIVRKGLSDEITKLNKRVEAAANKLTDVDAWKQKAIGMFKKKPELKLENLLQPEVIDILAIDKDSGLLLGKYSKSDHADSDIIAGMFNAIKSFAETAFNNMDGELALIDYDKYKIKLQIYGSLYYAIIFEGRYTEEFEAFIEGDIEDFTSTHYLKLLNSYGREDLASHLSPAMQKHFTLSCERLERKLSL